MQALLKRLPRPSQAILLLRNNLPSALNLALSTTSSTSSSDNHADGEWNDAWESAWLPDNLSPVTNSRAPWETDVNFSSPSVVLPSDVDAETKAFVHEMDENWDVRRAPPRGRPSIQGNTRPTTEKQGLNEMAMDYRLKKQRIHSALWMREIEKVEEARLDDSLGGIDGQGNDIEKLLDSCSKYAFKLFLV